ACNRTRTPKRSWFWRVSTPTSAWAIEDHCTLSSLTTELEPGETSLPGRENEDGHLVARSGRGLCRRTQHGPVRPSSCAPAVGGAPWRSARFRTRAHGQGGGTPDAYAGCSRSSALRPGPPAGVDDRE